MKAPRNVHLHVVDALGTSYLDTFADNTAENIAQFRKHAEWWKRYVRTRAGQEPYRRLAKGGPVFPVQIMAEPY